MNVLLLVVTLLLGQDRRSCTRAKRDYESPIGLSPRKIGGGGMGIAQHCLRPEQDSRSMRSFATSCCLGDGRYFRSLVTRGQLE